MDNTINRNHFNRIAWEKNTDWERYDFIVTHYEQPGISVHPVADEYLNMIHDKLLDTDGLAVRIKNLLETVD